MLQELFHYIKGYRTCHDCKEEGLKGEMALIGVREGMIDEKYVWYHQECAKRNYPQFDAPQPGLFIEIVDYLKGYRACHDCGEKASKKEMTLVSVPDGILDSKLVWQHQRHHASELEGKVI